MYKLAAKAQTDILQQSKYQRPPQKIMQKHYNRSHHLVLARPSTKTFKEKWTNVLSTQNFMQSIVWWHAHIRAKPSGSTKLASTWKSSQRKKQSATVALAGNGLLYPPTLGDSPSGFSDLRSHACLCLASKNSNLAAHLPRLSKYKLRNERSNPQPWR